MDEHKIFAIEMDALFPELDESPKVNGTAGEILERIADEWGIEDEEDIDPDFPLDAVYPSSRAFKAHQMLEEQIGKPGGFPEPDSLIDALINEGLVRIMTEDEFEEWMDKDEMVQYEEARSGLDEEWTDGLWET